MRDEHNLAYHAYFYPHRKREQGFHRVADMLSSDLEMWTFSLQALDGGGGQEHVGEGEKNVETKKKRKRVEGEGKENKRPRIGKEEMLTDNNHIHRYGVIIDDIMTIIKTTPGHTYCD